MARIKKALDNQNAHIFTLRGICVVLVIALFYTIEGWRQAPDRIQVDIPPDLRSGSTRGINERHPFNIYSFGYYIFQQLNNWPVNGVDDYNKQIERLSCYITPTFKGELLRDYEKRLKQHELSRTRALQEIPGRIYQDNRVFVQTADAWVAYFDVNVKESFRAEIIKDIFIRYPINIIRWDVDPECNLWGLALDGFYEKPKRLEDFRPENERQPRAPLEE